MVSSSSIFLSPLHLSHPKPNLFSNFHKQSPSILSPLALPSILTSTRTQSNHKLPIFPPNPTQIWRISTIPNSNFLISEANPVEVTTEQLVTTTTTSDWSSNVVSVLVFVAFVGLTVLTIGVIYIGVTDFLQKRENEKIDKQDAIVNVKRKVEQEVPSPPRGYGRKKLGEKTNKQPKPKPKPKPKPMPKQADKKPKPKQKQKPKTKSRGK